jgi:hypothetical protein
MIMVELRGRLEVLAVTLYPTLPFPVPPLPPNEIWIQLAWDVAVHAQLDTLALMLIVPACPVDGIDTDCGLKVNTQAPVWFTVNTVPPAMIVPERTVVPGFGSTENPTEPGPVPEDPVVM